MKALAIVLIFSLTTAYSQTYEDVSFESLSRCQLNAVITRVRLERRMRQLQARLSAALRKSRGDSTGWVKHKTRPRGNYAAGLGK